MSRSVTRAVLLCAAGIVPAGAKTAITTYHVDTFRTGWNQTETALTSSNASSLELLKSVTLDEQVDAQPLIVPGLTINGVTHDVVYVVTENNTIYAIDATTGTVLRKRSLGTPVPQSDLPGTCDNNSSVVGITSTPVIDTSTGTLYVMADTYSNGNASFKLHAVSLTTLADVETTRTVVASQSLTNGQNYKFNANVSRQRAALLEANGNIYAGFSSYCDQAANQSRGWLLGWNASTLAPLSANALTNQRASSANDYFLTSIWMAGFGIAADSSGSLYFSTSNSDTRGRSYNPVTNLDESVVKMSADLTTVQSYYTPTGANFGHVVDDENDSDVGAGGVMLLPTQPGSLPNLAVAGGKTTPLLLLNRDSLGGLGQNHVQALPSGGCWCGSSYYEGADGVGRVVASTGQAVTVYRVNTQSNTHLTNPVHAPSISTGQDGGFFTSVSSNGTKAGSAVVWGLSRPTDNNPANISLYAFDPRSGNTLYSAVAGTWPNSNSDSNLVPTVANGLVYVASYKQLTIFGLGTSESAIAYAAPARPVPQVFAGAPHAVSGIVTAIDGHTLTLQARDGRSVKVDFADAQRGSHVAQPAVHRASLVRGEYGPAGILVAQSVLHQKPQSALWEADR